MNRRKFIQHTEAFGNVVSILPMSPSGATIEQPDWNKELHWYRKPLGILQTVRREPDTEHYDAKAVADFKILRTAGETQVRYINNRIDMKPGKLEDFFAIHLMVTS